MQRFRLGLVVALGLLLVSAAAPTSTRAQSGLKVGFLLKTMQEERYEKDRAAFLARASSLGAQVFFAHADNDEKKQEAQFREALAAGCKVIVLQPVNTRTAGTMTRLAQQAGVKVVGYDAMLLNGRLDFMVMQDSWAVGRLQAEALIEWLRARKGVVSGKVALIRGQPGDSNAGAMSSGVLDAVARFPGLQLIADESHEDWSPDRARATAERLLAQHDGHVDAFICNNSGMARGVIAALQARGIADADRVFVAGSDADLVNIRWVARGVQAVEVWKKIAPLAERAADVAVRLARGETVTPDKVQNNGYAPVPTIVTPVVLVTRDNVEDTVVAGGFYKRDQVFVEN
jgi:D-xylose transport system substrate-binding protein